MQKVILFVALLAFAGVASAASVEALSEIWSAWKNFHSKTYSAGEEAARFAIFSDNVHKIERLNAEDNGVKYAINKFADLTGHEFKVQYASSTFPANKKLVAENSKKVIVGGLPDAVDWRNKGGVTAVKNQGQCGSCWSFSATGALEGFYFVNNGELLSFSKQQLVDCDDQSYGCNGGILHLAIEYAAKNGLETEADYPYTGEGGNCDYDKSKAIKVATGYTFITPNSTEALKSALVNSPVAIIVEADQDVFQFYSSGVVTTKCGANLDHGVLAVGYQKTGLWEAIIVKNSWGAEWGNNGYINIWSSDKANDGEGVCGILAQPVIPTL